MMHKSQSTAPPPACELWADAHAVSVPSDCAEDSCKESPRALLF